MACAIGKGRWFGSLISITSRFGAPRFWANHAASTKGCAWWGAAKAGVVSTNAAVPRAIKIWFMFSFQGVRLHLTRVRA